MLATKSKTILIQWNVLNRCVEVYMTHMRNESSWAHTYYVLKYYCMMHPHQNRCKSYLKFIIQFKQISMAHKEMILIIFEWWISFTSHEQSQQFLNLFLFIHQTMTDLSWVNVHENDCNWLRSSKILMISVVYCPKLSDWLFHLILTDTVSQHILK